MNEKTTPPAATPAAVPNIDKADAAHPVQALKTDEAEKAEPVITPAPKS